VTPPALGRSLDAGNAVDYLANQAYLEFGDQADRKRVLGAAVLSVWRRFKEGGDPVTSLRALGEAASARHLLVHATDPEVQAGLEEAGIAGSVGVGSGDLLGVHASNAAGTKIDYYVRHDIAYDVRLDAGGGATGELDVTFENEAPADAEPSYPLGPYPGSGLGVGDSLSFVTVTCAPGCSMEAASQNGEPSGMEAHALRGYPVFGDFVRANAASSSSLTVSLAQPNAWVGGDDGGTYRLTLQAQPTVEPMTATVSIQAPPGMRITDTNVPMDVRGDRAVWTGTLERDVEIWMRFQQPFPARVWG
ncbi:MAG TPA: hypothetical protein VK977_09155, partial [Actinomycetota bacterium]|nr:hypothetical protein [Actinomycetota bacterium]